ncbi:hypothetical protein EVJ58_g7741 [Rhodofomes roseus]|uniref:Uncharacterized protein n=1 Tax=Rhodofomes roseus TaxID=34475 RepID=A0A4Y9Y1D2_9APHY|nr:hypothetical protein EVJ58_g7741 [Rhodofomes roseus]
MFGENTMAGFLRRHSETLSRSPPNTLRIPNATFAYGEHFSQTNVSSTPRYNVGSYAGPNVQAPAAGPNTGAGYTSISPQHAWPMGDQPMQFSNSHPAFCEPAQPTSAYYNESAASHLVGYPESSQRTLLPETAYGSAYGSSYPDAVSFGESSAMHGSVSAGAQYGIYGIPAAVSDRQHGHGQQQSFEANRTSTYGTNNQYLNAQADFEQPSATHRMLPQLSPTLFHGLGATHTTSLYPMVYASPTSTTSTSGPSTHSEPSSALHDTQSSRLPQFSQPLRRHSMDSVHSVHDPMSPSSVPALVYDADTGDDYDDDSESDPPSASSELAHLPYQSTRTAGINGPSNCSTSQSQFTVGFDTPLVSDVHEVGKLPSKLRWIPQSLSTRTNVEHLRDAPSDSEEEYLRPSCPMLSVPLPPVISSSPTWNPDDRYEERDSYADAETSPYIPSQWRGLPGPAIMSSSSI